MVNNVVLNKKKKKHKRVLPANEQCLGRKMDFTQCTRKRKDCTEFCGSHNRNLPNGKIGDDGHCFNRVKGKRGRKPKNQKLKMDENSIIGIRKYIDGEIYLVDESTNVVFSYKENKPIILGYLNNGAIKDF